MNFRNSIVLMSLSLMIGCTGGPVQEKSPPHIILIVTDQQSVHNMSYWGNPNLSTPHMDQLASSGYAFTRSYAANPVCLPSRYTLMTGFYPSKMGIRDNGSKVSPEQKPVYDETRSRSLANMLKEAGYTTYYGGKVHLPGGHPLRGAENFGFETILTQDVRDILSHKAVNMINSDGIGEQPLFVVLSYMNPHDICEYGAYIRNEFKLPERKVRESRNLEKYLEVIRQIERSRDYPEEEFYESIAPSLPENLASTDISPIKSNAASYDDRRWRHRNWVYNRLVEEVDHEIGIVLEALMNSTLWDNSIIVFTSDHGDMQGAHGLINKPFPYEEDQTVPLVFTGGAISKGVIDNSHVVCGVDLVPTLCDFAGIEIPEDLPGISLKPLITGEADLLPERYIFVESKVWTQIIMDGRYKYTLMDNPELPPMLIDLETDRMELRNLINEPSCQEIKQKLHDELVARNISKKIGYRP